MAIKNPNYTEGSFKETDVGFSFNVNVNLKFDSPTQLDREAKNQIKAALCKFLEGAWKNQDNAEFLGELSKLSSKELSEVSFGLYSLYLE
jgi:hypothetical protein